MQTKTTTTAGARTQLRKIKAALNAIIHNKNLYVVRDTHNQRVINAEIKGGRIVVECLHTGAEIDIDGLRLIDGAFNPVSVASTTTRRAA